MQVPLQVTFRHMDSSEPVAGRIRQRAEELDRLFDGIISCRVAVECRHPRRVQGNLFRVRVDLKVPDREIVVGRDPAARHAHEDIYVSIRDAFDATRRLLEDYVRERRREVKLHAVPDHGRIARLLPERSCGFILSTEGNEIYTIVGPLEDAVLMRIVETAATPSEVLEAFTWATADDQIGTELEHRPRGVVAQVYDILKREELEPDERG